MADIYDTKYIEELFDEMAKSYEKVNYVTSFGFSKRWRRQFVENARISAETTVCDLMCGMGECWSAILKRMSGNSRLVAVDLSGGMLKGAFKRKDKFANHTIAIHKQNALENDLETEFADSVVSAFGIKTFSDEQKEILAAEIWRILKPNGTFSLIEVSVPNNALLKSTYMFYLKRIIPFIGRIFLGNPENYKMLGVYTEKFGNCRKMKEILEKQGFTVDYHDYFFGCATGLSGTKAVN
jgi:ubiquinone/menaquinone biosynthesis methyltransferase